MKEIKLPMPKVETRSKLTEWFNNMLYKEVLKHTKPTKNTRMFGARSKDYPI
jgi:hypothetical protein